MPISLLTAITDTRHTSGLQAAANASRSTIPSLSVGTSRSSAPVRAASARQACSTAWCSMAEHTRTPGSVLVGLRASQAPVMARLSASVPLRGEHHVSEIGAQQGGDLLAGVFDGHPGPPRLGVASRWVAETPER